MSGIVEALRDEAKRDDHRGAGRVLRLAADEIESLREQLATAQAAYLQFREGHEAKLAKATAALEAVEDALPVGIVVTFAGIPIDHTKLNSAVEAVRSCLREMRK